MSKLASSTPLQSQLVQIRPGRPHCRRRHLEVVRRSAAAAEAGAAIGRSTDSSIECRLQHCGSIILAPKHLSSDTAKLDDGVEPSSRSSIKHLLLLLPLLLLVFLIVASAVFRVLFCAGGRVRFVVVYLVAHNDIEKVLRCQLTSTLYGSDASIWYHRYIKLKSRF